MVGPFLPLFAALSLAAIEVELCHKLDAVSLTAAFLLIALVLTRQVLQVIDLVRQGHPVAATLVSFYDFFILAYSMT